MQVIIYNNCILFYFFCLIYIPSYDSPSIRSDVTCNKKEKLWLWWAQSFTCIMSSWTVLRILTKLNNWDIFNS